MILYSNENNSIQLNFLMKIFLYFV